MTPVDRRQFLLSLAGAGGAWLLASARGFGGEAVAAETAGGVGPRCPAVSAVAMDVPGAPGDLVATAMDGRVNLTWTAPSDGGSALTGYVVIRTSGGKCR